MSARGFAHALGRSVQVRIGPGVALIEPHTEMTVFAPCRCRRLYGLLGRVSCEVLARRRQPKTLPLCRSANNQFEKTRPFKPPMPEQFGVEWNHYYWIKTHSTEFVQLPLPLFNKVSGMRLDCFFRCLAIVQFFFLTAPGDTKIFYAGEFSASKRDWAQMLHRKIETDIAIEFAVSRMAGIAFLRTPDLPA